MFVTTFPYKCINYKEMSLHLTLEAYSCELGLVLGVALVQRVSFCSSTTPVLAGFKPIGPRPIRRHYNAARILLHSFPVVVWLCCCRPPPSHLPRVVCMLLSFRGDYCSICSQPHVACMFLANATSRECFPGLDTSTPPKSNLFLCLWLSEKCLNQYLSVLTEVNANEVKCQ